VRHVERLLAADVRALSDGGGEFHAARVPVIGPERVARFYTNVVTRGARGAHVDVRMLNGLPALVASLPAHPGKYAPLVVTSISLAPNGRIAGFYTVVASSKLTALASDPSRRG